MDCSIGDRNPAVLESCLSGLSDDRNLLSIHHGQSRALHIIPTYPSYRHDRQARPSRRECATFFSRTVLTELVEGMHGNRRLLPECLPFSAVAKKTYSMDILCWPVHIRTGNEVDKHAARKARQVA